VGNGPDSSDEEGDCSCRAAGAPARGAGWWAITLLALAAIRRVRRRET